MIKKKSVEEILEIAKVEEVVQDFVQLKRRGVSMIGLCPFHSEKTPSFNVSPAKGIYKCFGCGKAGDAVSFVMEHENLTFPEALRYLAKKYGVKLEETELSQEARQEQQFLDSLYIVNQYARDYYQDQLFNTDLGKSVGLNYFRERGFREDTIRKFGLGFAPDKMDAFVVKATHDGYNSDLMKKVGLMSQYGRDFFRNRVMFPIHNLSGKVIGFGGRILVKDVKAPKYINTPETEIYTKSKVLYGAYFAKRAIRQEDECILVEGYTDVLSLHQSGIENVVASSGTSLTVDQIRLIKRNTENIKILYDGDMAGIKAALRGMGMVLEQGLNVKIVVLPEGEDPDSYLKQVGVEAFKTYIGKEAKDFIMFQAGMLQEEAAGDPIKKANLIKDIVDSIAKIPEPIKRSLYVRECARIMEVEEQLLVNETNKVVAQHFKKQQQEKERTQLRQFEAEQDGFAVEPARPVLKPKEDAIASGDAFQEKDIIRILVAGGSTLFDQDDNLTVAQYLLSNIEDVLEDFDNKLYQRTANLARERILAGEEVSTAYFLNHPDPEIRELAINLVTSPYEYSENWAKRWEIFLTTQKMPDDNFINDSTQSLKRFKLRKFDKMIRQNAEKIKTLFEQKSDEYLLYLKLDQKLKAVRNQLAEELGTVVF
ncbi:MAG: DNA primase [Phaeodactylibacter sp.]|nr:DNA primase [Phaeodactylibacter sp.]MCB9303450.1 DNA primase [Lewinellaceae bacterium]